MINVNTNVDQADDNARQVIRHTKQVTRRRFVPEEEVRIAIEGILGEIAVTVLTSCARLVAGNKQIQVPPGFRDWLSTNPWHYHSVSTGPC